VRRKEKEIRKSRKVEILALYLKNRTGVTLTGILKALNIILRIRIEEKCQEDDEDSEEWWEDEGRGNRTRQPGNVLGMAGNILNYLHNEGTYTNFEKTNLL
jgi:hypothetical protein